MFRFFPMAIVLVGLVTALAVGQLYLALLFASLCALGVWDLLQTQHSLHRNYPVIGHLRNLAESVRPQIHQYFIESDTEGKPFDREQRSLVYERAKDQVDSLPFGTERNVTEPGFEWFNHSIAPNPEVDKTYRVQIGNTQCTHPYQSSILNISAMSFGALSAAAIRALNKGAQAGSFAHDTGEGGLSPYHLEHGGDIIWELGTGYFGARSNTGAFDPEQFQDKAAHSQVKMIEIKLSQGAKPGHGGVLPGAKVSAEIARTRGVPTGEDCLSPIFHSAFSSPTGLLHFVAELRTLSGGKPVGFKLCIGRHSEFLGICKAMLATGIYPDFVVIDGKEGGTGAAPPEFVDHVGTPLRDGLSFAHNALVGTGLRDHVRLGASGKVASGYDIAMCLALGADWCNSARGFMFALGCLQAQKCHTNRCPVGITTQDLKRQRALVVDEKFQRVANYHRHTVEALWELIAAAGLATPSQLSLADFRRRGVSGAAERFTPSVALDSGELLSNTIPMSWRDDWSQANASAFRGLA